MENNKKIGVFLCRCGGNISQVVDLDRLKEFALKQPDVAFAEYLLPAPAKARVSFKRP